MNWLFLTGAILLSLALRGVPLGIAHAIWSGVGLSLVCIVGWLLYGRALDAYALSGIALVTLGVVVRSFSRATV